MKIKAFVFFAFALVAGSLFAQHEFKPGFVIKNDGDTLFGEIDFQKNSELQKVCLFKDANNVLHEYYADEIAGYRFNDSKFFISKEINGQHYFLEYLIKGIVSIYYMSDYSGDHYYLDKEGNDLKEIPFKEGTRMVGYQRMYYSTKTHLGVLSDYMQDAPEMQNEINSIKKPDHYNLVKLAEDYHNKVCKTEACVKFEKKTRAINVSLELTGGVTVYANFTSPEIGGLIYLWAPITNERIYFKTGFLYNTDNDSVRWNIYRIPIQLQYIYQAYKIQPYISFGVTILNSKVNKYEGMYHTMSLNAGLNYKISKNIRLSAGFNSDYVPLLNIIFNESKFGMISHSFVAGVRYDL